MVEAVFASAGREKGLYESFYLRAVSPSEPVGAWIRYTVHRRPGQAARGSLWCTVFDAARGSPFVHKHTTHELSVPPGGWIEIGRPVDGADGTDPGNPSDPGGHGRLGPSAASGVCGPARWSLEISQQEPELRHLQRDWLYRTPLPRTKLTSPAPGARFDGTIERPGRRIQLDGWRGMLGHNWGAEHAERWIWLHGIDFGEDASAWLDLAVGRVLVAGLLTPWLASGAICVAGRRVRLGGLAARGVRVAETPTRCSLTLPGEGGVLLEAHVDDPPGAAAGWRYADPRAGLAGEGGGEHDVVNCSVARLSLNLRRRGAAAIALHSDYGGAYELGMRERDHGIALAPFGDG